MHPSFVASSRIAIGALAVVGTLCVALTARAEETKTGLRAQWRRAFDGAAADYRLARQPDEDELTLLERPTYAWARAGAHGGTYGSIYVWTCRGNAEAVACFWRYVSEDGKASLAHELHSLSPEILRSSGKDSDSWKPRAGLKRFAVPDAPSPAKTAGGRLQQMRALARDFTAKSVSVGDERTELRLLPQPLYRYESTDPTVIDGALFAFVCSIGTDPEIFLLLEARDTPEGPRWHFAAARFSHMDLFVSFRDPEVWQALRDEENTLSQNADRTYWVFGTPLNEPNEKLEAE
jgi:hypothetical protein